MNYQDKKNLIETLGAMLPHEVLISIPLDNEQEGIARLTGIDEEGNCTVDIPVDSVTFKAGENAKPYLRNLLSLTDEEKKAIALSIKNGTILPNFRNPDKNEMFSFLVKSSTEVFNWLIENKFDCFGLIKKGLAFQAKEGMYNSITKMIEMK